MPGSGCGNVTDQIPESSSRAAAGRPAGPGASGCPGADPCRGGHGFQVAAVTAQEPTGATSRDRRGASRRKP